jgi:hypothetical protein
MYVAMYVPQGGCMKADPKIAAAVVVDMTPVRILNICIDKISVEIT